MTQKMLAVKDGIQYFIWNAKYVLKVLMFQLALALMICGVLYVLNFRVSIEPLTTVISPVVEEVK